MTSLVRRFRLLITLLFVGVMGSALWWFLALPDLPAPEDSAAIQALFHSDCEPPPRAPTPSPGQPSLLRSGLLHYGFEWLYFTPCGSTHRYWVGWTDSSGFASRLAHYPIDMDRSRVLFLRGHFHITPPGAYGHMGKYSRQAVFTRVIDLRPTQPRDCAVTP
jgi:hypothetical protein